MSEQREDMTERDDLPGEVPAAADDAAGSVGAEESAAPTGKYGKLLSEEGGVRKLTGMYRNWFLDYASYVILERAVPHVQDGLKPVQRRILHAMKAVDDGRYNKVANIVGQTMQYHPHGDASIKDALVQLGQKDLLIDCQGNWGNILTGDEAAAGRYIEARLSKFALDVVFNKKTTEWMRSYDGRNEEPVTLPVKFPLLLAQGADGIAVGLASKILPHNFIELINAAIAHLQGRDFVLYPDFPTGGIIMGRSGIRAAYATGRGKITLRVKAEIEETKNGKYRIVITEIPYKVRKKDLVKAIYDQAADKKIDGIEDVVDYSSKRDGGIRIIVDLKKDANPQVVLNQLYRYTQLQDTVGVIMLALDDGVPKIMLSLIHI